MTIAKFGELEDEEQGGAKDALETQYGIHHPKAHLILEGSEQHEWGVVKDCKGCVNYIPEDAEIVGSWNKYGDGTFWVDLLTPVKALEDRAIQLFAELAKRREMDIGRLIPAKPKRARARKAVEAEAEESPAISILAGLKAGLETSKNQEE